MRQFVVVAAVLLSAAHVSAQELAPPVEETVVVSDAAVWLEKVEVALEPRPDRPIKTLVEAREKLNTDATNLAIAEYNIEQARMLEEQAFTLWLPTVSLTATYTLNDESVSFEQPNVYAPLSPYLETVYATNQGLQDFLAANPDIPDARLLAQAPGFEAVVQERHDIRAGLRVDQTLFNYRAFTLLERAEVAVKQAENGQEQVAFALERTLIALYFNAVQFKRLINIAGRNLELARINYERQAALFEEGAGIKFEVNRSQVALATALRDLENARLSYDLSIEALASYLEIAPDFDVESPPELEAPDSSEALISNALEERAEFEGFVLQQEAVQAEIDDINSGWWPTLSAFGNLNLQPETAFGGAAFRWNLGVQLRWVIYDSGIRQVELETAEMKEVEVELQQKLKRVQVEGEIRQGFLAVQSQQQNVLNAREEAALAAENVELTQAALDLDAATTVDVETAQRQRFLSEVGVINAEIQLQNRIYELLHIAGYQW